MEKKTVTMPARERIAMVRDRVDKLRYLGTQEVDPPAAVIRARKVVDDWYDKQCQLNKQREAEHRARLNEISSALIRGQIDAALIMVENLEKKQAEHRARARK